MVNRLSEGGADILKVIMTYKHPEVAKAAKELGEKLQKLEDNRAILRAPELNALYDRIKILPAGKARAEFGKEVNALKAELEKLIKESLEPKTYNL